MIEWIALAGAAYGIYNWLAGDSDSGSSSSSSSSSGMTRNVCGYNFTFLQTLNPVRDSSGRIKLFNPEEHPEYGVKHDWGWGPFCKFKLERAAHVSGVYLWVVNGSIVYIGETTDLADRFNSGYGNISPRNCYVGGQEQNCRMNTIALGIFSDGDSIDIWFHRTGNHKQVERELRSKINTEYNRV